MICSNCGVQNAEGSSFCTNCGKPLTNNIGNPPSINQNSMTVDPVTGIPIALNNQNNSNTNNEVRYDPNTGVPINQNNNFDLNTAQVTNNLDQPNNQINQYAQMFQNDSDKKKETMCEIGFWLSIAGVVLLVFGVALGLIVYVIDYYLAFQGLNTKKRGKAIATIVISSVSILFIVLLIVFNFVYM